MQDDSELAGERGVGLLVADTPGKLFPPGFQPRPPLRPMQKHCGCFVKIDTQGAVAPFRHAALRVCRKRPVTEGLRSASVG